MSIEVPLAENLSMVSEIAPKFDTYTDRAQNLFSQATKSFRDIGEKFNPPIKVDEVFDPQEEVASILEKPTSDRPEALKDFKEKLGYMYRNSAKAQEGVMEVLSERPDVVVSDLKQLVEAKLGKYYEVPGVHNKVDLALSNLEKRREGMRELFEKSETKEEVYENLFGQPPTGDIEVARSPIGLIVVCDSQEDLNYVMSEKYSRFGRNKDPDSFNPYIGKVIKETNQPGLEFSVIAVGSQNLIDKINPENSSLGTQNILQHEMQHSANWLLEDLDALDFYDTRGVDAVSEEIKPLSNLPWEDGAKDGLVNIMMKERMAFFVGEKDEILAKLAGGATIDETYVSTQSPDGSYYYRGKAEALMKDQVDKGFVNNPAFKFIGPVAIGEVFGKSYNDTINTAFDSLHELQRGGYSTKEIIFMMQHHPLETWGKVVKRIL